MAKLYPFTIPPFYRLQCPRCPAKIKSQYLKGHIKSKHNLPENELDEIIEMLVGKSAARTDLEWTSVKK